MNKSSRIAVGPLLSTLPTAALAQDAGDPSAAKAPPVEYSP